MPRGNKPGTPRPEGAGRRAGTPNKRTLDMVAKLEAAGLDSIAEIVWVIAEAKACYELVKNDPTDKFDPKPPYLKIISDNAMDLNRFLYPTRKAVDHTSGGEKINVSFAEFVQSVLAEKDAPKSKS